MPMWPPCCVATAALACEPGFDLGQRRDDDLADNLERARVELVERVAGRVPGRVVEVDQVDRGNAGIDERNVIVIDRRRVGDERALMAEASGGAPDDVVEPSGGAHVLPELRAALA